MRQALLAVCGIAAIYGGSIRLAAQALNPAFSGTMAECEDTAGCTTLSFLNNRTEGRWGNGAVADLVIEQFGSSLSIRRIDTIGVGAGIRALYTGVRKGDQVNGTVSWTWPSHPSGTTNWHATIQPSGSTQPKLDTAAGQFFTSVQSIVVPTTLASPSGMLIGEGDQIFIGDSGIPGLNGQHFPFNDRIVRMDRATGRISVLAFGSAPPPSELDKNPFSFGGPSGLVADKTGHLYTIISGVIFKINEKTGIVSRFAGKTQIEDLLHRKPNSQNVRVVDFALKAPLALGIDGEDDIFVLGNGIVEIEAASGKVKTIVGGSDRPPNDYGAPAAGSLGSTYRYVISDVADRYNITVDSAGNTFFVGDDGGQIFKVSASSGIIASVANHLIHPWGLAVDSAGNLYYSEAGIIWRREALGGAPHRIARMPEPHNPGPMCVDRLGNLYVISNGNIEEFIARTK